MKAFLKGNGAGKCSACNGRGEWGISGKKCPKCGGCGIQPRDIAEVAAEAVREAAGYFLDFDRRNGLR
jgi:RecJ-like exonuclease